MSTWLGKPPQKTKNTEEDLEAYAESTASEQSQSSVHDVQPSSDSDEHSDIDHSHEDTVQARVSTTESAPADDHGPVRSAVPPRQQGFYIDVPKLSKEEEDEYEYLPGHFSVRKVLSKLENERYLIQRKSDERDIVSFLSTASCD